MTKTLSEQAMEMYQRKQYDKLRAFKKAKKRSWFALGINTEMQSRIKKIKGTVSGRLPAQVNSNFPPSTGRNPMLPSQSWRLDKDMPRVLKYVSRQIHQIMGEVSHPILAHISEIREQEKFRGDPRFPLFQIVQRIKRYKEIFAGRPYLPIFGGPGDPA